VGTASPVPVRTDVLTASEKRGHPPEADCPLSALSANFANFTEPLRLKVEISLDRQAPPAADALQL
jgi:hypothetical protein